MTDDQMQDEADAPKRGRPSYADVKSQLDQANLVIEELARRNAELEAKLAESGSGSEQPASGSEQPAPPPAGPRKRVKILIHKKMTSLGRVLGGHFEELPVDEADAMIAAGEAVAA